MAGFSIDVKKDLSNLENLEQGLKNLRPALQKIAAWQERSTVLNFARQANPVTGAKWAPLQPETLRARRNPNRKQGASTSVNILIDYGNLRRDISGRVRGGDRVVMSSNLEYATTHQYGDPSRNIPQRQYVGTSPQDEKAYKRIIKRHLRGGA